MTQLVTKYMSKEIQGRLEVGAPTGTFVVGEVITGGTSAATAVIKAIEGSGASTVLVVDTITGFFADAE